MSEADEGYIAGTDDLGDPVDDEYEPEDDLGEPTEGDWTDDD